jgi:hypothetical protein
VAGSGRSPLTFTRTGLGRRRGYDLSGSRAHCQPPQVQVAEEHDQNDHEGDRVPPVKKLHSRTGESFAGISPSTHNMIVAERAGDELKKKKQREHSSSNDVMKRVLGREDRPSAHRDASRRSRWHHHRFATRDRLTACNCTFARYLCLSFSRSTSPPWSCSKGEHHGKSKL